MLRPLSAVADSKRASRVSVAVVVGISLGAVAATSLLVISARMNAKPEWMSRANRIRHISLSVIAYNADVFSGSLPRQSMRHPRSLQDLKSAEYISDADLDRLTRGLEGVEMPDPGGAFEPSDIVITATYQYDQIIIYASGEMARRMRR